MTHVPAMSLWSEGERFRPTMKRGMPSSIVSYHIEQSGLSHFYYIQDDEGLHPDFGIVMVHKPCIHAE